MGPVLFTSSVAGTISETEIVLDHHHEDDIYLRYLYTLFKVGKDIPYGTEGR